MKKEDANRLVVVLGSGRSGTSILTRFLGACGMRLSDDMVGVSEQNPEGAFEDREIFDIQTQIFSRLGSSQVLPMPKDWMLGEWVNDSIRQLNDVINRRVSESKELWGFKDPRTSLLLPLWIRVFNKANVRPIYLMAVRDPQAVVSSLKRQYGSDEGTAELFWLYKNIEGLYHTGGNLFIVHYENWFDRPEMIANEILQQTGLLLPDNISVNTIVANILKSNLNRSIYTDYELKNEWVKELYSILKECSGVKYDREKLMSKMMQCRSVIKQFQPWPMEAQKQIKLHIDEKKQLKKQTRKLKRNIAEQLSYIDEIRVKMEDQEKIIHQLTDRKKKLQREKIKLKKTVKKEIKRLEFRQFQLLTSYSYRVGLILSDAFRPPLRNTFLVPFRLFRLIIGALFFKHGLHGNR
jgi:hypothetical protein